MKTLDIVIVAEAFDAMELVLERPLVQIARHPDIERTGNAAHDVNAVAPPSTHEGIGVLRLSASLLAKKRHRSG